MLTEFITEYKDLEHRDAMAESHEDFTDFAEAYRKLPKAVKYPPKSFLSVIRRTSDENTISDYLGYLLDYAYTDEALKLISYLWQAATGNNLELNPNDISSYHIERERSLGQYGRIDILIRLNNRYLLAIEVKVYAAEGVGQTKSYTEAIDEEFPNLERAFVFLTLFPAKPSSESFANVLFGDLIDRLQDIRYADSMNAQLATNFVYHMKEYLMGKKTLTLSERTLLYLKHKAAIDDVVSTFTRDSEQIFEVAMEYPIRVLGQLTKDEWIGRTRANRGYQQFLKDSWEMKDGIWVHFEYDLSAERLLSADEIECMIHVEGTNAGKFFELFEKVMPKYDAEYKAKKLNYRPRHNRAAIACRQYPLSIDHTNFDLSVLERFFTQTLEEFAFLIPVVDSVYAKA